MNESHINKLKPETFTLYANFCGYCWLHIGILTDMHVYTRLISKHIFPCSVSQNILEAMMQGSSEHIQWSDPRVSCCPPIKDARIPQSHLILQGEEQAYVMNLEYHPIPESKQACKTNQSMQKPIWKQMDRVQEQHNVFL